MNLTIVLEVFDDKNDIVNCRIGVRRSMIIRKIARHRPRFFVGKIERPSEKFYERIILCQPNFILH